MVVYAYCELLPVLGERNFQTGIGPSSEASDAKRNVDGSDSKYLPSRTAPEGVSVVSPRTVLPRESTKSHSPSFSFRIDTSASIPGLNDPITSSMPRVFAGFIAAQILGIPFGLALAVNKYFRDIFFPPFEILRPIPPLAWVPASIIFWPTTEMSIAFVTFLGAFFTIVINVLGGARSIDVRYLRAAQSMGATQWDLFYKIILPGTLPSIFTGAAVGMGITWEVVLAGEMISGGGGQQASGGLGFFIWSSYMGGTVATVIVGMISIGIAGYLSSTLIRFIGNRSMPWRNLF